MNTSDESRVRSAGWGRRIAALFVDWLTCLAVAEALVRTGVIAGNPNGMVTLGIFVVQTAVFTALVGGSFGKLVVRLRVIRLDGSAQPLGLIAALMRSVLVALVIPPLVFTPDGRGLHDMAARSRTVSV